MPRFAKTGLAACAVVGAIAISVNAISSPNAKATPDTRLPAVTDLTGQRQVQVGDIVATLTPVPGAGCYSATGYGVLSIFKEGSGGSDVVLHVRDDCKVVVQKVGTLADE